MDKLVKRQLELLAKSDRTDDENAELEGINKTLQGLTTPASTFETRVTTMKLSEALEHIETETQALAKQPDPDRAKLLSKNLAAIGSQDHGNAPDAIVAIELAQEVDNTAEVAKLRTEISELKVAVAKLAKGEETPAGDGGGDGGAGTGDGEPTPEDIAKAEKLTVTLAKELLDGYVAKLDALKARVDSGDQTLKNEDVREAFAGMWDVKDAIKSAITALMAKSDDTSKADLEKAGELLFKQETPDPAAATTVAAADIPTNCPSCNAEMMGKEVCPGCGWKIGEEPKKDKKPAAKSFDEHEAELAEKSDDPENAGIPFGDLAPELGDPKLAGDDAEETVG